ncbi:glycosyltransferase [Oryzihumus leptocrescens]|uniref:Beta-monoglucosyldiacylglycerol synthase n=1 Tax=Oryzihumus leptocrescens TaxID=297536 RepID=A0A542ZIQ2_9MICO|nr:glycosyltransferase [Oryzihumus leptocrescens]TQL60231.1 cellulose synthase/poly-beta-1,6-N-acetylglucosamine synthase-like glycosyltransferase [Oryzihumus leptocrescens]
MNVVAASGGVFLASVAATLVTTLALFVAPPSRRERPGTGRVLTLLLSSLLLASGPVALVLLGARTGPAAVAALALTAATVAWLPLTRRWSWRGHAAWSASTTMAASYLAFMLGYSLAPGRGAVGTAAGLVLWALELVTFVLGAAFLWEVVDVAARTDWPRRSPRGHTGTPSRHPFVSLHVPAHNEPPDMVIETLTSLLRLDYPDYEVVMVDDNTQDPALWHPVRDFCDAHGIRFVHLEDWPGYKSGALNYVLRHATDPRAEVIGVVDADYIVDRDYLQRCATLFAQREDLGFVQTPQNYRQWKHSSYFRRLFFSYEYFFAVSQSSRNEVDGAIFGGTMGLIRRSALESVGGWDEWCITEDAEVSLKMLRAGWTGQHVERPYGHGVMPLTFEALKRQRFRWCFGGMQILKAHWRSLMPWDRSPDNHMTLAQRWAYLSGALQWFSDLLGLSFAALLLVSAADLALGGGLVLRRVGGVLLVLPPLLLVLGVGRALAALRLRSTAGWRDAVGALGLWLALGLTVAMASVRGLIQPEGVFLRTPKTREQPSLQDAVRANKVETLAGLLLLVTAAASVRHLTLAAGVVALLLVWHAVGLLAAPGNSLAAMRADLSPQMRRRRGTEGQRERVGVRVRTAPVVAGLGALAAAAVVGVAVAGPADAPGRTPGDVLGQLRRGPAAAAHRPMPTTRPRPLATPTPTMTAPGTSVSPAASGGTAPVPRPAPVTTTAAPAPHPTSASPTTAPTPAPTTPSPTNRPTSTPTQAGPHPTGKPTTTHTAPAHP